MVLTKLLLATTLESLVKRQECRGLVVQVIGRGMCRRSNQIRVRKIENKLKNRTMQIACEFKKSLAVCVTLTTL